MKKIITFVLLLGLTSSVAVFTGCNKESGNNTLKTTTVDNVKVASNKNSDKSNISKEEQKDSSEDKKEDTSLPVVFQGRIDNNSIEIKENDKISAARLSEEAKKFFDENPSLKEGSTILIKYQKNEYDQKVITEISQK